MRKMFKITTGFFLISLLILFVSVKEARSAPLIASYYLGTLPADAASVKLLSKMDLLIVSPDQFIVRKDILANIKKQNPDAILLAYVPSQSYNFKYWPNDLIYSKMTGINDEWWLRDRSGKIISTWTGIKNLNMDHGWSEYLVNFVNKNILNLENVDGIFFDMVGEGISYVNNGDVVLEGVAVGDRAGLDAEWRNRTQYLLSYAKDNLNAKFVVINGSSNDAYQKYVNGRMYETFPTPWEAGGSWSGIMTGLSKNQSKNAVPQLYVFNANSNNTGKQNDFRKVRFGLASSLLADNVYFGYDFGDQNHAQLWWYDEYDAKLGDATGKAAAMSGSAWFQSDVWRRDYANGLALVNPTSETKEIQLGGEYEKLTGSQDVEVNDGSVVDSVSLQAKDGLLLYKTVQKVNDIFYPNGSFLRFYDQSGRRTRNGFFAFENDLAGGARTFTGDLDNDGSNEKIVITGARMEIFNSKGERWFNDFPFGANYKGEISAAFGPLFGDGKNQIVVAGSRTASVIMYDYHGGVINEEYFPLGKKYRGGFSAAVAKFKSKSAVVLATQNKKPAEILIVEPDLSKLSGRFTPWGKLYNGPLSVASGDFNGDGLDEIAVSRYQKNPKVGFFGAGGKKLSEFVITGLFGTQKVELSAVKLIGERKQELVVATGN